MATTKNLQDIMSTLDLLQSRVQELSGEAVAVGNVPLAQGIQDSSPKSTDQSATQSAPIAARDASLEELEPEALAILRLGISELATMSQFKEFPKYFIQLAARTGLRLILLKRWTTGLQVFREENITLPAEAKKKRQDGRAPIPTTPTDIFEATASEATVYSGPVPAKHFPLDLTLMLGRGSRDRQIIILPLPSQGHWNTFLYLDADESTQKFLAVAEVLAQFALARMILLTKGFHSRHGRVEGILKAEQHRRQKSDTLRARRMRNSDLNTTSAPEAEEFRTTAGAQPDQELAIDPFAIQGTSQTSGANGADGSAHEDAPHKKRTLKLAPLKPVDPDNTDQPVTAAVPEVAVTPSESSPEESAQTADQLPAAPAWDRDSSEKVDLTPEMVLSQSGELPALPKAACHIMAVIEDPRTTATKLEAALAMDQALTAKVLRIANSPFYGAVREIKTVSEAIVRLGFVSIRNWTLVAAARSVFLAPGAGILYQKIWRQSVMSAMAGQLVAQVVGKADPEAVFIGGLMQNIGQLVLARSHPELFLEILTESTEQGRPYHVVEQERLGFDHGDLGALLIKEWNLSLDLEEAVRWHHKFEDERAQNKQVAAMIALGEEIALTASGDDKVRPMNNQKDDNAESTLSPAARYLGVTSVRLAELREKAEKLQIDPHFFS